MSDASGEVRRLSNTGTPLCTVAGSHSHVLATRLLPRARQFVVLSASGGSFLLSRLRPLSLRRPACAFFLAAFAVPFLGGGVFPPPPATCSARPAGVALNTCTCKPTSSSFGLLCGTVYFSLPYTTTTHKHGLCSWRNGGRSLPQAAFHRSLPFPVPSPQPCHPPVKQEASLPPWKLFANTAIFPAACCIARGSWLPSASLSP